MSEKRKVIYEGGAARVGPYERGVEYEVDAQEAARLVSSKGFAFVEESADITSDNPEMED